MISLNWSSCLLFHWTRLLPHFFGHCNTRLWSTSSFEQSVSSCLVGLQTGGLLDLINSSHKLKSVIMNRLRSHRESVLLFSTIMHVSINRCCISSTVCDHVFYVILNQFLIQCFEPNSSRRPGSDRSWWNTEVVRRLGGETWRSCYSSLGLQNGCQTNGLLYSERME